MRIWGNYIRRKQQRAEWLKVISFCNSIQFTDIYRAWCFFYHSEHNVDLTINWIKQYVKKEHMKQKRAEYRKHRKPKATFSVEIVPCNSKEDEEDELN